MGKQQNRRADKQQRRQRRQDQRRAGWQRREQAAYGAATTEAALERVVGLLALGHPWDEQLLAGLAELPGVVEALDRLIGRHWVAVQAAGWDPALAGHCARRLGSRHARWLLEGVRSDLAVGIELAVWLFGLPSLPSGAGERLAPQDARLLERVRALLAKAESTEFPDEAESLTAKAQELTSHHSLQRMLAEGAGRAQPGVRHCPLDDPYAEAKSMLLASVAMANRCQAVFQPGYGFSTVVGFDTDLRASEVLFASLLVQASRAMTFAGRAAAGHRRPSYRRSFLVAYAQRIGERLGAATAHAQSDVADDRLLPVLTQRNSAVTEAVEEVFPDLTYSRVSVSNGHGWAAGRYAADQAELFSAEQLRAG